MGALIKDPTRLMAAAAAAAAKAAAAEAAAAEAAATSQPWQRSEERTAVNLAAFAARQESNKAAAALHAAKLKVPQRYACDHEGCAKSYTASGGLSAHKRKAHPVS